MFFYYKILFLTILIIGSLISISANSWMGMWLGLEINLMAFIPLLQEKKNIYSTESSLKYFLTQALASVILLFMLILLSKNLLYFKNIETPLMMILNSALLTKMGMAPFHFWFPEVIEGLNWMNCLILLTWQKITPMILIMYNLNYQFFFMVIIIFSMMISGFMGINQSSLRKFLAYSSINHMAWMISAMFFSETIWFYYFIIYFILSINIIFIFHIYNIFYYNQLLNSLNQNFLLKLFFSFNFLSLGGLPPFLGFFPKWLTIQFMISCNWIFMIFFMVIFTLLTLYYYMRLIFNILIFTNNENNYYYYLPFKFYWMIFFNLLSLSSLIFLTLSFNFL
uniref:NADH-ubiquinone oxidoreductase chain 2 n=1 Tax=Staphylinidae sp. BMNH 1274669 TaxID=1796591 RepID=A0A140EFZ3_9COLE|nr:NADH dehydrogenase subunit 2 [Staphylinidae sp. BMNH 1274669]